ncbi:hypothetical protein SAMN04487939_12148 [Lysobacter sp. yr284]|uniref:hypothetical protein n=1 Tax=Lysobacter sp. yr284 TaxID=1761791 RepID=UPI0008948BA8|nr:hypothetical protein [Lysobacter sp. yr284]SDZ18918.1 hypothetical protein SAMN04487939_12148 [Lysobacter sp. yr284]
MASMNLCAWLFAVVMLTIPIDLLAEQPAKGEKPPEPSEPEKPAEAATQTPSTPADGKYKNPLLASDSEEKKKGSPATERGDNPVPSSRYPAETTLRVRLIPPDEEPCKLTMTLESGVGTALLTAVLPKVIDTGLASLSTALRAASGEDRKTRHYTGITAGYAYDYLPRTRERSWFGENGCLEVTSAHLESDGKPTLDALIPIRVSSDGTALAFDLYSLSYRGKLSKGRKVEQMTIAIEMTNPAATGNSIALLKGPFVPAPETFVAKEGVGPTSGWVTMPAVDDTVGALVTSYQTLCSERAGAAKAYIDAKVAEIEAGTDTDEKKKEALKALSKPDPDELCGRRIDKPAFAEPGQGWSSTQEEGLRALETRLTTQQPINFTVVVTETRNVNKFLYTISQKFDGDQKEIRDVLMANLDPATRKAKEDAEAVARRQRDTTRITNASIFEQKMVNFHDKVRLYEIKRDLVREAHATLALARKRAEADRDNQQLWDAVKEAKNELDVAEGAKSTSLAEALVAKQQALEAAVTADITITDSHSLRRFPS